MFGYQKETSYTKKKREEVKKKKIARFWQISLGKKKRKNVQ